MRPAWSILFFTTLAGLAQGLFLGLLGIEVFAPPVWHAGTLAGVAWGVLALLAAGLVASVFHLGRPERAWRAASQWRTSWLSREVIVLPALMAAVGAHALALTLVAQLGARPWLVLAVGLSAALGVVLCAALWWCTGMIYGCLRMVQDWATPLTPLSFAGIGAAHGLALASAWFACALPRIRAQSGPGDLPGYDFAPDLGVFDDAHAGVRALALAAVAATLVAVALKAAWWRRRRALVPKSTLQTALAIDRPDIRQMSMGMTGGSYNTREFFHGRGPATFDVLVLAMIALGAVLPVAGLLALALPAAYPPVATGWALLAVVLLQTAGVLCERWLFFAWARHPQNLYYQKVA
jgi:DMSO reductase anchor subunit